MASEQAASANRPPERIAVLEDKVGALNRLVEISLQLNSTLQLELLLERIMRSAAELTGAEAASILLVNQNTNELEFTAATGESGKKLIGMVVPMKGSIAGTIIDEDRAMIIRDVEQDPRHYQGVDDEIAFETRSILGVPMRIGEQLIGVLEAVNKLEGSFSERDLRYITILASQAAVAIHTAQLVSSLEEAYADLNRVNKIKSDFIAIASHELRTPLGVILGYATFLKEDAPGEFAEHTDALFSSALQMRSLIEGMTNLRYVQLEESELSVSDVRLREIIAGAVNDIRKVAEAREHLLQVDASVPDVMVRADKGKVTLALTNVLHNAVKFTSEGGVIFLSAEQRDGEMWITVRDNGYGIPEDKLEKIFEQFYQVEDPMTRRHGGLGLGLTIARAIVEQVGGRVWAESPGVGEGSKFSIALPLA